MENLLPQSKQIQPKLLMSLINQIQHLQRKKEIHPRVSLPARYIFVNLIQSVTWNKLETFAKYSLETIQSQNSCPRFRHTTTLRTKHVEIHRCKSAQRDLSCRVKRFSMLLVVSHINAATKAVVLVPQDQMVHGKMLRRCPPIPKQRFDGNPLAGTVSAHGFSNCRP